MSLRQFTVFAAVAQHRSITKAAQLLRVSQPSASKHIKALENDYGVKLFERNGVAMELTEEGRILLQHVDAILFHVEKSKQELSPPAKLPEAEPLKIGGSYAASAVLLPSLVALFKTKHSETPVLLRTGSTNNVKRMLLSSEIEIALVNENPANVNLVGEPFREEKLVVFVAPNHRLARKKSLALSDLSNAQLVGTVGKGRANATEKILKGFANQGLPAKIAIRCSTPEAVKAIVKKGTGVGILFADTVMPEIKNKVFRVLEFPGIKLIGLSYIIHYKNRPLSPNAVEFLALLRKERDQKLKKTKSSRTPLTEELIHGT